MTMKKPVLLIFEVLGLRFPVLTMIPPSYDLLGTAIVLA